MPRLKIKFAGSKLAPRKAVHLLGSWDSARRAGHGQCVSRIQGGAPASLFYTYQAPVETRDRCCVGKVSTMCCSVLTGAIFHRAVNENASFQAVCGQTLHQFNQFSLSWISTAGTASAHAEGLRDLYNFYWDTETKQTHKSDEIDSRSVWDLRELLKEEFLPPCSEAGAGWGSPHPH